jgi:transposase InsO family protein
MDVTMKVQLVTGALEMPLGRRRPEAGPLLHSDRGSQYACERYQSLLAGTASTAA